MAQTSSTSPGRETAPKRRSHTSIATQPASRLNPVVSTLVPRGTYFNPPDLVAQRLLGKLLIRTIDGERLLGRIVETEAYFGIDDPAAHAYSGRTARTEVLYGPPGHAYVYLIYGLHACLNVSCEPEGQAGCVLIRALEPLEGLTTMAAHRKLHGSAAPAALTAGPGRLCQALGITRAKHNGTDLTNPIADLQIHHDGFAPGEIAITPRIGITRAAERMLRYTVADHPCLSRGRFLAPATPSTGA